MLYPLLFQPIFKEHVWGGRTLEPLYGKQLPPDVPVGESWEISDRPEGASVVANGPLAGKDLRWLMEHHTAELLGSARPSNGRFPLLVKILDCRQAPSVQVHPPGDAAQRLGGEPKTEVWYIAQADPDARLTAGLLRGVKRGQFERKLGEGRVLECLHTIPVRSGDAMLVPSGRIHAIGAGIVLFEIQQNSNTTYRVHDWDRLGSDGKRRELHLPQALASIDFDDFEPDLVRSPFETSDRVMRRRLAETPWFEVEEWQVQEPNRHPLRAPNRPVIFGVASGNATVTGAGQTLALGPGRFCLIPASVSDATVETGAAGTFLFAVATSQADDAAPREAQSASAPSGIGAWRQPVGGVPAGATAGASPRPAPPATAPSGSRPRQEPPAGRVQSGARSSAATTPRRSTESPSRQHKKHRLQSKLIYSPFLRLLLAPSWFRVVILAIVAIGLVGAVLLPKIWTTTPAGFQPLTKVSLLDKAQAFMLRRSAEKAMARGDHQAAALGWRNALANNMGDPSLARGLLRNAIAADSIPTENLPATVRTSDLLLRLTQTNRADLDLVCTFLDKAQLYGMIPARLEPIAHDLSGNLQAIYAKCIFFQGDFDRYDQLWGELSPADQGRPDMVLTRAAYLAGWREGREASEAEQVLAQAAGNRGPLWSLANRLQMAIAVNKKIPEYYREALERLQETQADNGIDNADYWTLLASVGPRQEAVRMAKQFVLPPRTQSELVRLARAKSALGLEEDALKLMQAHAQYHPTSDEVWLTYAALLSEGNRWEDLRRVALQMRLVPELRNRLEALSYIYEGRADLATAQTDAARLAFNAATNLAFRSAEESSAVAASLLRFGYPTHAQAVLERAASGITNRVLYLDLMSRIAFHLKDEPLMMSTCQALYELDPHNADYANRYAAAMLIRGERLGEAVSLTWGLHTSQPDSEAFRLNHALALVANRRLDEADAMLRQVTFARLQRAEDINSYYQTMFELNFRKRDFATAQRMLDRINWSLLFPSEVDRLSAMQAAMPARGTTSSPVPSA